jgi:hypothetical protein
MKRLLAAALALLLTMALVVCTPAATQAAPVNWIEVSPTDAGRQWWDEGSLRISSSGTLKVLSRFQPAASAAQPGDEAARPRILGDLYVMEIDCGQALYRDTSINGLPQWGAQWEPVAGDGLIAAVIRDSCSAAGLAVIPQPSS